MKVTTGRRVACLCLLLLFVGNAHCQRNHVECYERHSQRAQRCIPGFVNAAYGLKVEASNTCGQREPQEYCLQTGVTGVNKMCLYCDKRNPQLAHDAALITDLNNNDNPTWWQSETMNDGPVQDPSTVNLTLHLGKSFEITYVRLKFRSSRPESFAIYKRTTVNGPWLPYHFYSASCETTYRLRTGEDITRDDETKAICTGDESDISPLTDANIAFSTLDGRPSAYQFERSPVLQEFVTATDIKIVLRRLNTFGDEVFGDPLVLKSYFYAISDIAVGGRCKCNGHAGSCESSTGQGLEEKLVCKCAHNTMGDDCEQCLPFYNDRPWIRATAGEANECQQCDCNGNSNRCEFDDDLYRESGHGGRCQDCGQNTAGAHCERCKDNYYRRSTQEGCEPCRCNAKGAEGVQCDQNGKCRCKPGVTGDRCDRCLPNYFNFGPNGCRQCQCSEAGSRDNRAVCATDSGTCTCKEHVEGPNCDRCKRGYYNLDASNPSGCTACFCYGHSTDCSAASGYRVEVIHSDFSSGVQGWKGEDSRRRAVDVEPNPDEGVIGINAPSSDPVYFVAPSRYLGNQRLSYGQQLTFNLRVDDDRGVRAGRTDLILEGDGKRISAPITAQGNRLPNSQGHDYKFRLVETEQWTPSMSGADFQRLLSSLTAIKIRGTYSTSGVGYLDNVRLGSAQSYRGNGNGNGGNHEMRNVERCVCPEGYVGQFCESCAPNYYRTPPQGGPYAKCALCNCNRHSETCDPNTGRCICEHNTYGENCELCKPGYYGNALRGTEDDCNACPCPNEGNCMEVRRHEVVCVDCPEGYTGNRCDMCADGYWGEPDDSSRGCQRCDCSGNIDPNAVGNCDTRSGECLKCIYNTTGHNCDRCRRGYYGDPSRRTCRACNCHESGSISDGEYPIQCDPQTGQCPCRSGVMGRECNRCDEASWNLAEGCEDCNCDLTGSYNRSCNVRTGQCYCRPGVTGRQCNECERSHYDFSPEGCKDCQCHPRGSVSDECDPYTGQCTCRRDIHGIRCHLCPENQYNVSAGCIDCPPCYGLVQDRVNILRRRLIELREIINDISTGPIDDAEFRRQLNIVNQTLFQLLLDAKSKGHGFTGNLSAQFEELKAGIAALFERCSRINVDLDASHDASDNARRHVDEAESLLDDFSARLKELEELLKRGWKDLEEGKEKQDLFGKQSIRLTELADLTRIESTRQETMSINITITANLALNISKEALRIARLARDKPAAIAGDLERLKLEIQRLQLLYNETQRLADRALTQAREAFQESLTLLVTVESLTIIDINVQGFKDEAADIRRQAEIIKNESLEVIAKFAAKVEEIRIKLNEANVIYQDAIELQKTLDHLLGEADSARSIARNAVEKAERILKEAQETLRTLREFDKTVRESRIRAELAMTRMPDIEAMITEAEEKTKQTILDLRNALADAREALSNGKIAVRVATDTSQETHRLLIETTETITRINILKIDIERLSQTVDDETARLERFEKMAESDALLIDQAMEKSSQARATATETSKEVDRAMASVNDIITQLKKKKVPTATLR